MTILEKSRELIVPIIFTREGVDSHNQKTVVFLETSITFKCWDVEGYEGIFLKLVKGRSGRLVRIAKGEPLLPEPMLKVYMVIPSEETDSCQQIDGFLTAKYEGLTIKVSKEEKLLTPKEAIERINSGTVMFLNENLTLRTFET